jgi:hypothetical protein
MPASDGIDPVKLLLKRLLQMSATGMDNKRTRTNKAKKPQS